MDDKTGERMAALMGGAEDEMIQGALDFVRHYLGMEVAYLSEFVGDDLVFRAVSAPGFEAMVHVGGRMPLDAVYCRHILAGRLPELIPDTAAEPVAQGISLTVQVPIKSHVSVPIRRTDGSTYGMFCCLSRQTKPDLTPRDLEVMRAFASLAANEVNERLARRLVIAVAEKRVNEALDEMAFDVVYQPIMDARSRRPKGFEALCRFRGQPYRSPDKWFAEAGLVGLQEELEITVIEEALKALPLLPPEIYVSVNASPSTVLSGDLPDVFKGWPQERIVLEVTEHSEVESYEPLLAQLDRLRFSGVRLAVDDAGAGYSGLQHIVRLRPDLIKLDVSLTTGIDGDLVRRSLAAALLRFAGEIDGKIVAEGVETEDELAALQGLGVPLIQGWLLGKPLPLADAVAWFAPGEGTAVA
ncbi:MAG: sensor domain-containing phosphodiesterase [Shimia sp.]